MKKKKGKKNKFERRSITASNRETKKKFLEAVFQLPLIRSLKTVSNKEVKTNDLEAV